MRKIVWAIMLVGLLAAPAHAAVYWDDEMEGTVSGEFYFADRFLDGTFAIDTSVKMSGTASKRVRFYRPGFTLETCNVTQAQFNSGLQCGGESSRLFTPTADAYTRFHFMMSGSSTPISAPTANCLPGVPRDAQNKCLFQASTMSSTKMSKRQSAEQSAFVEKSIRGWWQIGKTGGTTLMFSAENVSVWGQTTDTPFSSISLQSNRWYCIETHEKVNTIVNGVAQANGIIQAWVDGVQVLNRTNVINQRSPSSATPGNYLWREASMMRQNGLGYFWFDRYAAGNQRIGCVVPGDTTPPSIPGSFTVQ